MKNQLHNLLLVASFVFPFLASSQAYTENFDDVSTLAGSGWVQQNNSAPIGTNPTWYQGVPTTNTFNAYNGATNSYIACNYGSSGGSGTISNWLITPNRIFRNGDVFTFYTRRPTPAPTEYPDRLEVRLSTNGASTNVGTGATVVGDFTTLLLSVNPTLTTGVYPQVWTQYTIIISGLPAPTSGRIAFRYFVTNAGPGAPNSDYIGLDNVVYTPYVCPAFTMTAGGALTGGAAGSAYSLGLTQTGALGAPNFAITAGALPPGLTLASNGTISGTPTATGTFNFTATVNDASGCSGSQSYSITVVCPANPISFATAPSLCENGVPYTLVEGAPGGGTYSGTGVSGGEFDPSSGTQTITYDYTDPYGCPHASNYTMTVNTPPTVSAGADTAVCIGSQLTLNGSGAVSYDWDNSVVDGVAFTPSATTYTVTGTDANGCENSDQIVVSINALPIVDAGADTTVCDGNQIILSGSGAVSYDWDNSVVDGVAFTPSATTYTVTGTDANGCENTDQITVSLNALPTVNAGADVIICEGESTTLTASGTLSYSWNQTLGAGVSHIVSPSNTTTYTVTGTDANGCENTDEVVVTVTPLPTVSIASIAVLCLDDASITLSQGSPAGGTYSGPGVSAGVFNPSVAGVGTHIISYEVTENGCDATAQTSVVVDGCLGIESNSNDYLSIFPNPASSELNIVFENTALVDATITLTTMDGKIVFTSVVKGSSTYNEKINVIDFAEGVYFVQIRSQAVSVTQKVVLN